MSEIRSNIQKQIEVLVKKEGSPKAFAEKVGATKQAVNNWLRGSNAPDIERIATIAHAYDMKLSDFLEPVDSSFDYSVISFDGAESPWVEIPYYGSIAAGEPIEMIARDDTYLVPKRIRKDHPNSGVLRACGNSWNRGGIYDGFFIVVDFDDVIPKNDHEPFAVGINDTCTVKSIQVLENGLRLLPNSYDETIKPIVLDYDYDKCVRTLGKVVWTFAPFDYDF